MASECFWLLLITSKVLPGASESFGVCRSASASHGRAHAPSRACAQVLAPGGTMVVMVLKWQLLLDLARRR